MIRGFSSEDTLKSDWISTSEDDLIEAEVWLWEVFVEYVQVNINMFR